MLGVKGGLIRETDFAVFNILAPLVTSTKIPDRIALGLLKNWSPTNAPRPFLVLSKRSIHAPCSGAAKTLAISGLTCSMCLVALGFVMDGTGAHSVVTRNDSSFAI